jgi:hypothetical protein
MRRKSILMLSDDAHFVRACADLDVDLTVAFGMPQKDFGMFVVPSGKPQVFVENSVDVESVLLGLYRAGVDPADFDAIYSTDEGGVVAAAALGKMFDVPSIPPDVAALFRDKSLAKATLRAAGVDTAQFVVIDDLCDVPEDFSVPFEKAVLKPVAGGATYYASIIESRADMRAAVERARDRRRFRTFILEEFVPGQEWHADGVVFGGELQFVSVGGYRKSCLNTISSNEWMRTYVFDPVADAEVYERVTPFAERVLRTLGLADGVFHMELFHDADLDRLVFGECAARRGGVFIEEEVSRKFGVSLAEAAVQCALGVRPVLEPEVRPGVVGSVFLPYSPGVLVATPSAEDLVSLPNVEHATVEWPVGFSMSPATSTIMKVGQAMLVCDSREELFERSEEVINWFAERSLVAPADATASELREWYANAPAGGARPHSAWAATARA